LIPARDAVSIVLVTFYRGYIYTKTYLLHFEGSDKDTYVVDPFEKFDKALFVTWHEVDRVDQLLLLTVCNHG